ncbi:glcg protein [Chromatiales bacterium (ex Bugula neritina AB1)]|nr:glcg protein [Chromatiales bacterium (ex Bugula neritina AB1)]
MDLLLADAKKIIEHTLVAQKKNNFKPMAVVVLGSAGTIRASESQDGTSLLRPKIAHGKAHGAIAMGIGSRALFERAKGEPFFVQSVNALSDGALVPVPGGVLVRDNDGNLLGAVGVTGDLSDNDETCAVAGIEAAGFVADTGG